MIDTTAFEKMIANLNPQQREAVNCDENCVVTAGAGSGKTMVLSYRFLRLVVARKAKVDEILTLTFSRAAAAEMQERIHRTLLSYQEDPEIHAQMKLFSEATITTIDSFCNRVVASDPTRYGIGGDYVMDEDANREMARECAHIVLSKMEDHPGLRFLATIYNPDDLIDSLFVDLACNRFHPSSTFDATEHEHALRKYLRSSYDQALSHIFASAEKILALDGSGKTFESNIVILQQLLAESENLRTLSSPEVCLDLLSTAKIAKCRGKKDFVGLCNEYVDFYRKQWEIAKLACAAWCDKDVIGPLYEVIEQYHQHYLATKRERAILTFGDIAHMARDILLNNQTVRRYFQRKYCYIMIDEFQDTNQLQRDIIYLIGQNTTSNVLEMPEAIDLHPEKLFLVGDEKQSIYRFRGADVAVFKAVKDEIVATGGKLIQLLRNYRSEPALITFFNQVFEPVMARAMTPYEAQFESLEPREAIEGLQPSISVLFKELPDEESDSEEESVTAVQAEAYAIANSIEQMVHTDNYLISDTNGIRRPSYTDIAILFRTSSNQMHYEKALRLAGIPYTISSVQSLFLEAPANDVYHLLQLLVFPHDRLAFVAALRSPLCRISDDALIQLLDSMASEHCTAFPTSLSCDLTEEDLDKYTACKELFEQLQDIAQQGSVAALVSHIWFQGGYRYYLLSDPLYQVYLEHFEYIYELAIQYDTEQRGLPAFLDYLRPRLGQNQKLTDVEPLRDNTDGVHVMTVHKSKGLEFPIVILANMGGQPRGGSSPAWIEFNGFMVPRHMRVYNNVTNIPYEMGKEQLQAMETAEMKRLFYVALTRAKTHILLTGCQNTQNMGDKAKDKNFLALFFASTRLLENPHALGTSCKIHTIADAPLSILRASVSAQHLKKSIERMAPLYQQPLPMRTYERSVLAVTEYGQREEESPVPECSLPNIDADALIIEHQLASAFGTWVHTLLQKAITLVARNAAPKMVTVADAEDSIPLEIARLRLSKQEQNILVESGCLLANNFLSSSLFAQLLAMRPEKIESEVAFSLRYGDLHPKILHGSIDLVLQYTDCVRIIDFKTDSFHQPELHAMQLKLYRQAAQRIYTLPVYSALCYVRSVGDEQWITDSSL